MSVSLCLLKPADLSTECLEASLYCLKLACLASVCDSTAIALSPDISAANILHTLIKTVSLLKLEYLINKSASLRVYIKKIYFEFSVL